LGDRDKVAIKERINVTIVMVLSYSIELKSRDEIFEEIGLYKNTKNFHKHTKPLIEAGWLHFTLPNKLTSRDQKYYTTDLGKKLLAIISTDSYSEIIRTPVESSNIASVGYDKENQILEIEFHHGAVYQYFNQLSIIREKGRQVFLENSPDNFTRILHDYSDNKKGFIVWKSAIEELI
jgi:hypothetical protein